VRPSNALHLYRVRLRARLLQECFALAGIAAGVALLFASQVSSSSLQSSVAGLSHGIAGKATLQLLARGPQGFPASELARVREIPGVRVAAPLLEAGANAIGPRGSESVELVGADPSLSRLGGALVHDTALSPFGGIGAVVLPAPLSRSIGVSRFGQEVTFQIAGRTVQAPLYAQLGPRQIGRLVDSPVAIAPLSFAQEMTGLHARLSRILVQPARGAEARVRSALQRLAAGRLNVEPTSYDGTLFAKAATASNQSSALFAMISALVGFLFAFNATLLTVPQRRRLIADLRRDGYTARTVIAVLLLDAVVLGAIACALGLALGDELSIHLFRSNPAFLSLAFAVGSARVVSWQSVALAVGGGMLAATVAVLSPLRDVLARNPLAAITTPLRRRKAGSPARLAMLGGVCLAAATAIVLNAPRLAIPAMVLLVAALLLELPLALAATLALARRAAGAVTSVVPHVAVMELQAAGGRALAVAATGAIAVFGSIAIQGAHGNLLAGLNQATGEANALADVWVSPAGSYNLLSTASFAPTEQSRLEHVPGVRTVRIYRSGLLDFGERRVLVSAPPSQADPLLPTGQIEQGNAVEASARVRAGGWLVLSRAMAAEHHLHVGQAFTLPSPDPTRFRVAALSNNLGWAPGAIVMSAADYARAWGSDEASAFIVLLDPGVSPTRAARAIDRALGPLSGLTAQTAAHRAALQSALSRAALARLTQIATLILVVAVLAMAAAMGAMIWQRRPQLAKLKLEGIPRASLWHTMLLESLLLLAAGCLTGAIFGVYGQQMADRALASVIDFPILHTVTAQSSLGSVALVIATATAILAIPGYLAASVPAALALQD
jgi:putative ABC transport system permease protein